MRRLCVGRPAEWWETDNDGARLALDICSVCPGLASCDRGRRWGMVQAGVAWNELGFPAGICACGYPLPVSREGVERSQCFRCRPRQNLTVPCRRPGNRAAHVAALLRRGVPYRTIGADLGISKTAVGKIAKKLRPQAVSTGGAE